MREECQSSQQFGKPKAELAELRQRLTLHVLQRFRGFFPPVLRLSFILQIAHLLLGPSNFKCVGTRSRKSRPGLVLNHESRRRLQFALESSSAFIPAESNGLDEDAPLLLEREESELMLLCYCMNVNYDKHYLHFNNQIKCGTIYSTFSMIEEGEKPEKKKSCNRLTN